MLAARGYDQSHALNRSLDAETYQNMTADDIAQKVASRRGLTPARSTARRRRRTTSSSRTTRPTGSSSGGWRAAIDCEVEVERQDARLPPQAPGASAGRARAGARPCRRSGRASPASSRSTRSSCAAGTRVASRRSSRAPRRAGRHRARSASSASSVRKALGGGRLRSATGRCATPERRDALAKSVARAARQRVRRGRGHLRRRPAAARRRVVQIDGVGKRFGGDYTLASTHPRLPRRAATRRSSRSPAARRARSIDLATPAPAALVRPTVVVGVVTQNDDPDSIGRVRVKYPALGDDVEGWWARIAAPGAGNERGAADAAARRRRGAGRVRARRRRAPVHPRLALERHGHAGRRPRQDRRLLRAPQRPEDRDHRRGRTITVNGRQDTLELESKATCKITTTGERRSPGRRGRQIKANGR